MSDLLSTPYHLVNAVFELLYLQGTEVGEVKDFLLYHNRKRSDFTISHLQAENE